MAKGREGAKGASSSTSITSRMGKPQKPPRGQAPPGSLQPSNTFKYGMPVYGLAWPPGDTFYLCGGGGSVSSGIQNRVVAAQRALGNLLTDQVADSSFGLDCPMKMALLPDGRTLVLAMAQGGVLRLDIEVQGTSHKLVPATGDFAEQLRTRSRQGGASWEVKCLCFTPRGDALVLGGVDGAVKVLAWPSLDVKLHLTGEQKLADSIRVVAGAPRAHRFAAVLDNGTAEIWDFDRQELVCRAGLARGEQV